MLWGIGRKRSQSGNIMLALFAAIGAVGVVGATSMNVMKGPVRGMHQVTQKTIAENNMIASIKLAVMAASQQPNSGDCDGDNTVEPIAWSNSGTGPRPAGGGYLPANIGASLQDPWGNTYGYCVWDHGSAIQTTCPTPTQRLRGAGVGGSGPVIAIISSGPDRTFQTSCANAPTYINKVSGSDDIVLSYTYAEASSLSGGLWNLKSSDLNTAEINKNLEVTNTSGDKTFALDRETGVGDFIGIRTGFIAAKGVEPVSMAGGLKVDNDTNVTQCNLPQHRGILRYHMSEGLQVCDGTQWASAGGGAVPSGTIAAFASNTCPSGWSEYTPARGRFLRGRDPSGTNDVVRNAGSVQGDANRSHSHTGTAANGGAHTHTGSTNTAGSHTHSGSTSAAGGHGHSTNHSVLHAQGGEGYGYRVDGSGQNNGPWRLTGVGISGVGDHTHGMSLNAAGDHSHTVTIDSGGAHTHALTIGADGEVESRPKNVAVTFCVYNGGVPVKEIAGLGNLHDVVLSAPQVGQVLMFQSGQWVNRSVDFLWEKNGTHAYYNGGNVGIGTNAPPNKLHVVGNIGATGWVGAGCEVSCDTAGGYSLMYADGRIVASQNLHTPRVTGLTAPDQASDAANKGYVDGKFGTLTNGRWCTTNGSVISCTQAAPLTSESDPKVGAVTNGRWCRGNGTQVVCDQAAPSSGGITAVTSASCGGDSGFCTATCPSGYLLTGCTMTGHANSAAPIGNNACRCSGTMTGYSYGCYAYCAK